MYPIICTIGPFTVYSYGLALVIAFMVGISLAKIQAKKEGIDPQVILNFSFRVLIAGIIGGRLFYVIENFQYYIKEPLEVIMLQRGGLSWFGGLFLGLVVGIFYLKTHHLSIYRTLDLIVPFVALGQAWGRIGCFLNGCCYGKVSRFGLYFPVHGKVLIPTQAYSSLGLIVIFVILRILQDRSHKRGEIFFSYLILYSLMRFFMEFLRGDHQIILLDLTLFQIISVVIFCFSIIKLISIKISKEL